MTVVSAINRWLTDTRNEFRDDDEHHQELGRALDNFLTSEALGHKLDEFLKLDVLIRRLRAAEVPAAELRKALSEVYKQRLLAASQGDLESYVHEMVVQDGALGTLNTFGNLIAAYAGPPRTFVFDYRVRFGPHGHVASSGRCKIEARTECEAEAKARDWVEKYDPYFDDRVGPSITLSATADPTDEGASGGTEDQTGGTKAEERGDG